MIKNTTPAVDAIGQIHIEGDIIPRSWFKHIVYGTEKGTVKPDLLAMYILANIRYWYTPTITRDEISDEVTSIVKKFDSDKLQKSYDSYAKSTGSSKRQVKAAFDLLKKLGLITIEFRNITVKDTKLFNVMYVEPVAEKILDITFNERKNVPPPTKICTTPLQKFVPPPTKKRNTNTYITTKNTNINKSNEDSQSSSSNSSRDIIPKELEDETLLEKILPKSDPALTLYKDKINTLCNATFNGQHSKVAEFFYSIDFKDDYGKLYDLLLSLLDTYTKDEMLYIIDNFKIPRSKKYNISYVKKAFILMEDAVEDAVNNDITKTRLQIFCEKRFGEDIGKKVYALYKVIKAQDVGKSGNGTDMKKKNINYIIDKYGIDNFLKCVDIAKENYDAGIFTNSTLKTFTNLVKKVKDGKYTDRTGTERTSLFPKTDANKSTIPTHPVWAREIDDVRFKDHSEHLHYDWKCECGEKVDPWKERCPKCNAYFEWREVNVPKHKNVGREGVVDTIQQKEDY